jgi:hypothetical protein
MASPPWISVLLSRRPPPFLHRNFVRSFSPNPNHLCQAFSIARALSLSLSHTHTHKHTHVFLHCPLMTPLRPCRKSQSHPSGRSATSSNGRCETIKSLLFVFFFFVHCVSLPPNFSLPKGAYCHSPLDPRPTLCRPPIHHFVFYSLFRAISCSGSELRPTLYRRP